MKESVFQELAGLTTEARNPDTQNLDTMSTRDILEAMNREDRKVPEIVAKAIPEIEKLVERIVSSLQAGGRLLYIGAGTSGRLGVLDAAECPPTFGTDPWQVQGFIAGGYDALVRAVEGAEDNPDGVLHDYEMCCINEEDVVVGITASRRTPFVLGGLRHAKSHGCFTALLICNEPPTESMIYEASVNAGPGAQPHAPQDSDPSPVFRGGEGGSSGSEPPQQFVDVIISLPVGPEALTGSTRLKAGTATKLALNMISTASWVRMGKCYGNLMVDLRMGSQKLQARARRIMMELTGCEYEWADELLRTAGGELKTALVMHFRGLTSDHAREVLEEHRGKLKEAIHD
ncbi:MAG: N-acetylmuramic acid 6-phosphate etherase [Calditrichaeota bacterium]|nr:N-acetylmuramic acid 6-phosphate etherase [Calditrichota bacterium]